MASIRRFGVKQASWRSVNRIAHLLVPFVFLFVLSFINYLLFHSLVEICSIIVGYSIFVVASNSKEYSDSSYLLFLGLASCFVGTLDLVHTLAYKGMGVFPGYDANLPTQLWIAARYLQSISLIVAPRFLSRKLDLNRAAFVYAVPTALVFVSLFVWPVFPDCYIEGVGLTTFKRISEYLISAILLASMVVLHRHRDKLDSLVYRLMMWAILAIIVSELAFTFYISVYGISNLIGHLFKLLSVILIYRAAIVATLQNPYGVLFRELADSERRYKELSTDLQTALSQVKQLQGYLPICASCKKIRDDQGYWEQIEGYISRHSEAVFSHSICPDCAKKLYPEFDLGGPDDDQS